MTRPRDVARLQAVEAYALERRYRSGFKSRLWRRLHAVAALALDDALAADRAAATSAAADDCRCPNGCGELYYPTPAWGCCPECGYTDRP